jgi:D-alanyl-D-alanine carboxypeptidase/D-alanyl-D-alanine-endopeptidase (penicillin-binding protein 4)
MLKRLLLLAFLLLAAPALAQQAQVEAALEAAPKGTRFGLLVVDETGQEVVAIAPDQRFIPASNTKLFTTAAAYALLTDPNDSLGARIGLVPRRHRSPDVAIKGYGSVSLSTAPDCVIACLAPLIDKLAANTRTVSDIIVDDSTFADQRWSPGMSWNNIGTDSGPATSALVIDRNELPILVTPGAVGQPPQVAVSSYYTVTNAALTVADGETRLGIDRAVGSRALRIHGTIKARAAPWRDLVGLDNPADFAGWLIARELAARGVKVRGKVIRIHRPVASRTSVVRDLDFILNPAWYVDAMPLSEMISATNKISQNLFAELLIRRLNSGRAADAADADQTAVDNLERGLAAAREVFEAAGIPRAGYDFSDGSGMSTYNRLSPRATIALLRWAKTQPWGEAWYASLPIAGVDGTLKRRFLGTPLAGNLAAKTGSLNATTALSGRFRARSGRMLTFAFFANDVPDGTNATAAMETALLVLAEAN